MCAVLLLGVCVCGGGGVAHWQTLVKIAGEQASEPWAQTCLQFYALSLADNFLVRSYAPMETYMKGIRVSASFLCTTRATQMDISFNPGS